VDGYDTASGKLLWSHEGISGNTIPSATLADECVFVGAGVGRGASSGESAAASNCCLRITPESETGYELLWKAENAVCSYMSPMVHAGCVYYVNSVGVLYCLDAATGKEHYARRIDSPCWAQPIGVGDRVYLFGKNGVTTVIKSGATFEKLASNSLWKGETADAPASQEVAGKAGNGASRSVDQLDLVVYGVAAVDAGFFIRTGTNLMCVRGE
jgi:outer membrane protein assembly factor BamB